MRRRPLFWVRFLVLAACAAKLIPGAPAQEADAAGDGKPDLYYLVVDKSGSIKSNGLIIPIKGAVTRFVGQIPDNAELRAVLFDHEIGPSARWPSMSTEQTGLFTAWFETHFKPASGDTHLYDAVAHTFTEVQADATNYRKIHVIILSDGDNDPGRNAQGNPRPTKYKSWTDLESLSKNLKRTNPLYYATWYTLGFEPGDASPSPESGITRKNAPDAEGGFVIAEKPSAEFDAHPKTVEIGQTAVFLPLSERGIEKFTWTFSDGQTSGEARPKVSFKAAGTISVTLQADGPGGEDVVAKENFLTVAEMVALKAEFACPAKGSQGESISFFDRCEGQVNSRNWLVDGAPAGTDKDLAWTFDAPGEHEVKLVAKGKDGKTAETTHTIQIAASAMPPKASFHPIGEVFKTGTPIEFIDDSSGLVKERSWDFNGEGTSSEKNPKFTFEKDGKKTVRLTVRGPGGENSAESPVEVLPLYTAPTVEIEASKRKGTIPFDVELTAKIEGDYSSVAWTLPDGSTVAGETVRISVAEKGELNAAVKVTPKDPSHETANASQTIVAKTPFNWGPILKVLGIILLLILAFVAFKVFKKARGEEVYGEVKWEYEGRNGTVDIYGHKYEIARFGVPGWTPEAEYMIRNREGMKLYKGKLAIHEFESHKPFTIPDEKVVLTFLSELDY